MENRTEQLSEMEHTNFTDVVSTTSEALLKVYDRVRFVGYCAVAGVLIIVLNQFLAQVPGIGLDFNEQVLYAICAIVIVTASAVVLVIQNVHAYRLEALRIEYSIKSLQFSHEQKLALTNSAKPESLPERNGKDHKDYVGVIG